MVFVMLPQLVKTPVHCLNAPPLFFFFGLKLITLSSKHYLIHIMEKAAIKPCICYFIFEIKYSCLLHVINNVCITVIMAFTHLVLACAMCRVASYALYIY